MTQYEIKRIKEHQETNRLLGLIAVALGMNIQIDQTREPIHISDEFLARIRHARGTITGPGS
jgi:hypothetical protein